MKYLSKMFIIFSLVIFSFLLGNNSVFAATTVKTAACYFCGTSGVGGTYDWKEINETADSNCIVVSGKTKTTCTGTEYDKGACYCCGGSQGCTYDWKEANETVGGNCAKVTSKTKTTCNGSNTSSGSGACWYCEQGSQGAVYKWTSDGKTPGVNCFVINGMKESACSGVPESGTGTNGSNSGSGRIDISEGLEGPDANLTVGDATCDGILGSGKFKEYLVDFLNIIRIVGVAMVIIFSTIDFGKAIIAQDNEALKKSSQTAFKRLTIAIVIFFLPIVLNILLSLIGLSGICI